MTPALEHLGRYRDMLTDLEAALRRYGEFGDSRRYASNQAKLARHLLEQGDYERAEELLLECRELLTRSDPSPFLVTCESSLSDLYREWRPPYGRVLVLRHAYSALAHARAQLGSASVLRTAHGYALGGLASDAEAFLQSGDTRLWRGPYLEDLSLGEETVAGVLYQALHARAEALLDRDPTEAARLGRLMLLADPYDIRALHLLLRALQATGQQQALERCCAQGRRQLAEVGEMLPERWDEFVADPAA